jgi:3-oxoacyl-[acyl-carrier protein] reductase
MATGGKVILISTTLTAASTIIPHYLLYLATKGAIEQMVRGLARDLASKEISVNAVSPGPTDTDLFHNGMTEPVLNYVKGLVPRGRLGKPEEVAEALAFFSSDASGWVTGQILRVNGGMA